MGIGTDVYPHNMLDEMRLVSYIGRVVSESPRSVMVGDVFNAATIGALVRSGATISGGWRSGARRTW